MKSASMIAAALLALCVADTVLGQTAWPAFMPSLEPDISASPVPSILPNDIVVEAPAVDIPADKARWSGRWRGWAGRDRAIDTRLVVAKLSPEGATIFYAAAAATLAPYNTRADAKFIGNELQATIGNGANVSYRMRPSGDLEFIFRQNRSVVVGILSREK